MTLDRQFLGDVALALLISVAGSTLVRPASIPSGTAVVSSSQQKHPIALASAADRQVGVFR